MTIGENVLAGFQAGGGSRSVSGIGGFIRAKLAEAKAKSLGTFKQNLETQGAIDIAAAEGGQTKRAFQTNESGATVPITFGENQDQVDFAKGDKIFSPSEGLSGSAKTLDEIKNERLKQKLNEIRGEGGEGGNVIQQSAGTNLADATGSGIAGQQVEARRQAMEFLKANGAPVTEANIQAVLDRQGG